ncbi:MAG: Arc family DNA-binding protein [Proteobacteria bacterium]|nr:Arc family DNA-binding protein [Pseudomonadota bacterium]
MYKNMREQKAIAKRFFAYIEIYMNEAQSQRARGRPRKPPIEGDRYPVTARLKAEVRAQVEAAADRNGCSLAQEVEARVQQSFRDDAALAGDRAMLLRMLGGAIWAIEQKRGQAWNKDYLTGLAVRRAMNRLLDALLPPPPNDEIVEMAGMDVLDRQQIGELDPSTAARVQAYEAELDDAVELGAIMAADELEKSSSRSD